MHKSELAEKPIDSKLRQVVAKATTPYAGRITITRDDQTNEWVIELGPGLDLLEVIQVLNQVQHQAIVLMQEQLLDATLMKSSSHGNVDQSLRDTVAF